MPNMFCLILVATLISPVALAYREERTSLDSYLPIFRLGKSFIQETLGSIATRRYSRRFQTTNRKLQITPEDMLDFPCDLNITLRSEIKPNSVHRLRPGDIDVIGAIGDSLTAGFGVKANDFLSTLHEGRGSAFSIGGEGTWRTHLTLPNILKLYNPNIYGHSLDSLSVDRKSKFNVAEVGAISENMPYMAKVLVKRITTDKRVDLANDWKMITVLIGHNDFCSVVCYEQDFDRLLTQHKNDMLHVLRIFRNNLPRTVVNYLAPIHLRVLLQMTDKPPQCELSHPFSCPCIIGLPNLHLRSKILDFMTRWQKMDMEIANLQEFDKEDFAIIAHPYSLSFSLPKTSNGGIDYGYAAPDCFHGSQRGHAKAANDLWNSLLEPYGRKTSGCFREFERVLCPTNANPYIFTKSNSKMYRPNIK